MNITLPEQGGAAHGWATVSLVHGQFPLGAALNRSGGLQWLPAADRIEIVGLHRAARDFGDLHHHIRPRQPLAVDVPMDGLNAHAEQIGENRNGKAAEVQIFTQEHGDATFAAVVNIVNRILGNGSPDWACLAERESCHSQDTMNRIRELRHARRLSLVETARLAGTTVQQLSRLELGERRLTVDWMRRIAGALGVRVTDLLPEAGVEVGEFIKSGVELNLIHFWRSMTREERAWLVVMAKSRGINLTSDNNRSPRNQPKMRRA